MVGEFVRAVIVENKGGAKGVAGKSCQGGGAFVVEFNIARINCWASFEVCAAAQVATGHPQTQGTDREQERDQVQVGTDPCRLVLTSSLVVSLLAAMVQKSLGYEP